MESDQKLMDVFSDDQIKSYEKAKAKIEEFPVRGGDIIANLNTDWFSNGNGCQSKPLPTDSQYL